MLHASGNKEKKASVYSSFASNIRLELFRSVINSGACEAILLLAGIDARENIGCARALNYLLFGCSGQAVFFADTLVDDAFEDVMVLIYSGGVRVYGVPAIALQLVDLTAAWANVEFICMDERSFKDQDLFEEHKMANFKRIVKGFSSIGIPTNGDLRQIEKWPIIQSFALDVDGQSRFFSLEYNVVDVSKQIENLYTILDPHTFTWILLLTEEQFLKHWNNMLTNVDSFSTSKALMMITEGAAQRNVHAVTPLFSPTSKALKTEESNSGVEISNFEEFVSEPLQTYFAFAAIQREEALRQFGVVPPSIKFWYFDESSTDATKTTKTFVSPLHFTAEVRDPQSPLWCARTYLLSSGKTASLSCFGKDGVVDSSSLQHDTDSSSLSAAVRLLVKAYGIAIATVDSLKDLVSNSNKLLGTNEYDYNALFMASAKTLGIMWNQEQCTVEGVVRTVFRTDVGSHLVHIGIFLKNLLLDYGKVKFTLGTVMFGETVIVTDEGKSILTMTRRIPVFEMWGRLQSSERTAYAAVIRVFAAAKSERDRRLQAGESNEIDLTANQSSLGTLIQDFGDDSGFMFTVPSGVLPSSTSAGKIGLAFQYGIVLLHPRFGLFNVLTWRTAEFIDHIDIYDDLKLDSPIVVAFHYTAKYNPSFFVECCDEVNDVKSKSSSILMLCFNIHSSAKRSFLIDVLPVWKTSWNAAEIHFDLITGECSALLEKCQDVSENVALIAQKARTLEEGNATSAEVTKNAIQILSRFWCSTELTRVCHSLLLGVIENSKADFAKDSWEIPTANILLVSPQETKNVMVHLFAGIPGSGKHKIVANLKSQLLKTNSFGSEIVMFTMQEGIQFNSDLLENKMRLAINNALHSEKKKPLTSWLYLLDTFPFQRYFSSL